MAPGQLLELGQPGLQGLDPVHPLPRPADRLVPGQGQQVLQLQHHRAQAVHLGLGRGQDLGGPGHGPVAVLHVAPGLVQLPGALPEGLLQLHGMAQGLALRAQLEPFPGPRVQLLQIGDLLGQPLQAFAALGLAALAGGEPGLRLPHRGAQVLQFGADAEHFVQQAQVALLGHQGLVVVLAGQAHPDPAGLAQIGQAAGAAVEPGPAAAAGGDLPAQHHRLFFGQPALAQEGLPRLESALGHRLHHRPVGSLAHQVAVAPGPHQEGQGVHQEGLARAGLAGEDREARAQLDGEILDQGEVLDAQGCEHGTRVADVRRPLTAPRLATKMGSLSSLSVP